MGIIRFLLILLVFYFVYKLIRNMLLGSPKSREENEINENANDRSSRVNRNDVIDADFEEIKDDKDRK